MADRSEMPLLRKKMREVVRQVSGARTRENTLSLKLLTIIDCYLSVSLSVSLSRSPSRPVSLSLSYIRLFEAVGTSSKCHIERDTRSSVCVCAQILVW